MISPPFISPQKLSQGNFVTIRSATYPVNMPARTVKKATDTAFQNCDCLDSITVLPTCSRKSSITPAHLEKGAEVRKVKRCRIEAAIFLPQLKGTLSTGRALNLTGLWRDSINARELKVRKADGKFAC